MSALQRSYMLRLPRPPSWQHCVDILGTCTSEVTKMRHFLARTAYHDPFGDNEGMMQQLGLRACVACSACARVRVRVRLQT